LLFDPSIAAKIQTMQQQVRWQDPLILRQGIDQTQLVLNYPSNAHSSFSFFVIGDTDAGTSPHPELQEQIAREISQHQPQSQFILHTGDVGYPFGTKAHYLNGLIRPYQNHALIQSSIGQNDEPLTFTLPMLPVPGNHDYYDLPFLQSLFSSLIAPLRPWLKSWLGWDLGWHRSEQGKAYAETFLDCLQRFQTPHQLAAHLNRHYTAHTKTVRCLQYQPDEFTRLPNRYYTFRFGGIDFFALDSNTFNHSQSDSRSQEEIDHEQLHWLQHQLIDSWHNPEVRGRILYLHHSPYTTEHLHCDQPQVMAVRRNLRRVLDQVAIALNADRSFRPVDLILSGHSHCLEHLQTLDTGHADSHLNWIVCGGSGMSLRHQRRGNSDLMELSPGGYIEKVARSHLFVGRKGQGSRERRSHTFLRIDVQPGTPLRLTLQPFIVEKLQGQWSHSQVQPFVP
jgi:3',5'-cyclic AMP phosphodiesterase CpdA